MLNTTGSITLCGIENEARGNEQTLCPNCVQVRDALNVCRLGPESLRELFDRLQMIDPSEGKVKMERLRDLGVQMDMQDQSQQSRRPRAAYYRDGRLVVSHADPEAIRTINEQIATINAGLRSSNSDALPAPDVTGIVNAQEMETQSFHSILVHRLDYRPQPAAAVGNVVVFSELAYAARMTKELQLATPAYYRNQEDLKPGIRDHHDGTLTKDATRWASFIMDGSVSAARVAFVSSGEPWVYCASHYRTDSELRRLRRDFRVEYGYEAATRIDDPDAFAVCLGVNFAMALDKTADVSLGPIDEIGYARSSYTTSLWDGSRPIDTLVHVYHGSVHYEDLSGRVDRQEHWFDPSAGPRAWFTKKTSFKDQNEYRFAVTTPGVPVRPKHYVAVSPELRELTFAL